MSELQLLRLLAFSLYHQLRYIAASPDEQAEILSEAAQEWIRFRAEHGLTAEN